jgi:hypothetical protein
MTERLWVQTPTVETIFHAPFTWIKAWKQKLSGTYPSIVTYAVILQKGGWTLRTVGFITKDKMKACQLTRTKLPPKKKNNK